VAASCPGCGKELPGEFPFCPFCGAPLAVVRTPPAVSLYHRFENSLFAGVLERLRGEQTVVLPRTPEQEDRAK